MVGTFSTSLPFGNFNLLNLNEYEAICIFDVQQCGVCWESELVWGENKFNFRFIKLEMSMRPEVRRSKEYPKSHKVIESYT